MAWTYGFFNSVNGDRLYNAHQMSALFEGLVSDGVYQSVGDKMAVRANSGMTISIASGRGYFNKHWVNNDTEYLLTLEPSDLILDRWVGVFIRVDDSDAVRSAEPVLRYGELGTLPIKPEPIRSELVNEYCLAYVYVGAKHTEITQASITDTRQDTDLCGWVTGLVDQITPETLYEQFTAQFNDWFEHLQVELDEETATRLTNALPTGVLVTLKADSWNNNQQNVTVTNMNSTKSVIVQAEDTSEDVYNNNGVKAISQATNKLTFSCDTVPDSDIIVKVLHMGI